MTATDSQLAQIKEKLSDQWWRLNNLYYITDKHGKKIKFRLNKAQTQLYNNMWYLNIVLKARQQGFTTFIQIFMLDRCLFGKDVRAGVIAHNREDAEDFFNKKIKYAYDNLPEWLKSEIKATQDSASMLTFSNGSSIRVGTSLRSGTYQYLHVSEFGKLCATRPDRAEEIVAGAFNTVHSGNFIFVESTAEGAHGRFYDMCQDAQIATDLTQMDFKFFFFPWFEDSTYTLKGNPCCDEEDETYFEILQRDHDIELSIPQKNWYSRKRKVMKGKMKQEYPSTPEEAFEVISEHAIYGAEFRKIREQGRICDLQIDYHERIFTFWDIGRSKTDATCIWFMQYRNGEYHFIDYYQNTQKPISHYVSILQSKGYVYGDHYLPHDAAHNDHEMKTYQERLNEAGIHETIIVPRIHDITVGIDETRQKLPFCRFDKERCKDGITALERYSYQYDERKGMYIQPLHNWASHPSDAFRQFAQGFVPPQSKERRKLNPPKVSIA